MKNSIKLKITIVIIITLIIIGAIGKTISYFTSRDEIVNKIIIGDVDIEIDEYFESPINWKGEKVIKIVKIKNESKSNALIRVALVPRWIDEEGYPWAGDVNIVKLNPKIEKELSSLNEVGNNKWIDGEDGYYYYDTIVPKGEKTVEILNSVEVNIPDNLKNRYRDKKLIIDVKAEAVQATKDSYKDVWRNIEKDSKLDIILNQVSCS